MEARVNISFVDVMEASLCVTVWYSRWGTLLISFEMHSFSAFLVSFQHRTCSSLFPCAALGLEPNGPGWQLLPSVWAGCRIWRCSCRCPLRVGLPSLLQACQSCSPISWMDSSHSKIHARVRPHGPGQCCTRNGGTRHTGTFWLTSYRCLGNAAGRLHPAHYGYPHWQGWSHWQSNAIQQVGAGSRDRWRVRRPYRSHLITHWGVVIQFII